jgi:hypothetical protein
MYEKQYEVLNIMKREFLLKFEREMKRLWHQE